MFTGNDYALLYVAVMLVGMLIAIACENRGKMKEKDALALFGMSIIWPASLFFAGFLYSIVQGTELFFKALRYLNSIEITPLDKE